MNTIPQISTTDMYKIDLRKILGVGMFGRNRRFVKPHVALERKSERARVNPHVLAWWGSLWAPAWHRHLCAR